MGDSCSRDGRLFDLGRYEEISGDAQVEGMIGDSCRDLDGKRVPVS